MYVTDEMIGRMALLYGNPQHKEFSVRVSGKEFDFIKSTQTYGRNHDVTLYITKDNKVIVNAKHFYPPGLYRAPSGGLKPGEDFVEGIQREVTEETGCEIELDRFLLRTSVSFRKDASGGDAGSKTITDRDTIRWRSFVFLARYIRGDFSFTDRREIREVRLAEWSEFEQFAAIMRQSDKGGLHYRAALHEAITQLL
jgi:8-oxo-dGTP pyrophosphatase MutT (NUDIX family)